MQGCGYLKNMKIKFTRQQKRNRYAKYPKGVPEGAYRGVIRGLPKNILFTVSGVFIITASLLYAIESGSLGSQLSNVEKEEYALIEENRELTDTLVSSSSLSNFELEQEALGYTKPSSILYLKPEEVVAQVP